MSTPPPHRLNDERQKSMEPKVFSHKFIKDAEQYLETFRRTCLIPVHKDFNINNGGNYASNNNGNQNNNSNSNSNNNNTNSNLNFYRLVRRFYYSATGLASCKLDKDEVIKRIDAAFDNVWREHRNNRVFRGRCGCQTHVKHVMETVAAKLNETEWNRFHSGLQERRILVEKYCGYSFDEMEARLLVDDSIYWLVEETNDVVMSDSEGDGAGNEGQSDSRGSASSSSSKDYTKVVNRLKDYLDILFFFRRQDVFAKKSSSKPSSSSSSSSACQTKLDEWIEVLAHQLHSASSYDLRQSSMYLACQV